MTQVWPLVSLKDVCEIIDRRGITPKKLGSEFLSSGFRVISAKNIKNREITPAVGEQRFVDEPTYRKWMKSPLLADDVLLTSEAPLGEPAYVSSELQWCLGQRLFGIRTIKDIVFGRYLFYALQSSVVRSDLLSRATGATAQGIRQAELKHIAIPVPPVPEQKRIVAILDEAFAAIDKAIENAEKNLANARELFNSYRQSVFVSNNGDWKPKRLGDLTVVQSGGTPLKSTKEYWDKGEIPWYSSGELNDLYTTDSAKKITEAGLNNSNAKLFPKGSLLIGMYDTAALKMSIIDREATFNQAIAGAKPNTDIDLIFAMHAINAEKPEILSQRRGVRQKNLSLSKIKDIQIPFPTADEQRLAVKNLSQLSGEVDRLESIYQEKLNTLAELRQSLLQNAFVGELR